MSSSQLLELLEDAHSTAVFLKSTTTRSHGVQIGCYEVERRREGKKLFQLTILGVRVELISSLHTKVYSILVKIFVNFVGLHL